MIAPPASETRQHIARRSGQAIIGEPRTSSIVVGSRNVARGFRLAHSRWATATAAKCSSVNPNSRM